MRKTKTSRSLMMTPTTMTTRISGFFVVFVLGSILMACEASNHKIEHLNNFVNYVKGTLGGKNVCSQSFADPSLRDSVKCNMLLYFFDDYKKKIDSGMNSFTIEEVEENMTSLDFGEPLTDREVYRLILYDGIKSDTSYLLIGDNGIKSFVMVNKGGHIYWL